MPAQNRRLRTRLAWSTALAIGAVVGSALPDSPLLAIAISVPIAIVLGLAVDRAVAGLDARRTPSPDDEPGTTPPPVRR